MVTFLGQSVLGSKYLTRWPHSPSSDDHTDVGATMRNQTGTHQNQHLFVFSAAYCPDMLVFGARAWSPVNEMGQTTMGFRCQSSQPKISKTLYTAGFAGHTLGTIAANTLWETAKSMHLTCCECLACFLKSEIHRNGSEQLKTDANQAHMYKIFSCDVTALLVH